MPRAVAEHKTRREEDYEEDYDDEAYDLSGEEEEEEVQAPRRRTARAPKKLAYSDEESSSEVEEEPRPRKSKKKAKARNESEDDESDDGRGKALVVRGKTSKAVAKRASSPKPKKKSRKVEESDDDNDDDGEEMMKVERYKLLDYDEIKPEFLYSLMDTFERDQSKVMKWVKKGYVRGDLMKKEYNIDLVLDKECSKKDREKWDKFVKKIKKSSHKYMFKLIDEEDPYSKGSTSHTFVPVPTIPYMEAPSRNHRIYDETVPGHQQYTWRCEACYAHMHACGQRCTRWCPEPGMSLHSD